MPKPRKSSLESSTARRKLPVAKRPYWLRVSPGIALGYRRNEGAGTWVARSTLGAAQWTKRIAWADDLEPKNGREILDYWQAIDAARKLARRRPGDDAGEDARPLNVGDAIDAYQRDLEMRGAAAYNAKHLRLHVNAALASKPVGLLSVADLIRWREAVMATGIAAASVNRIRNSLRAALSLAAERDPRVANAHFWSPRVFKKVEDTSEPRNTILGDDVVAAIVRRAHEHDTGLGLLVQVIAETGSRPSQIVRLTVGDLDLARSRLLMPRSGKGHSHRRAAKMQERVSVPISSGLAALLGSAAKGRAPHAALLVRSNGLLWAPPGRRVAPANRYRKDFRAVVSAVGLEADIVTLYALRHSAISRALLRGVPTHLVAQASDTSEKVIRTTYARSLTHHADEIMRKGLLQIEPEPARKVVMLPTAR